MAMVRTYTGNPLELLMQTRPLPPDRPKTVYMGPPVEGWFRSGLGRSRTINARMRRR